jgi:hypothetical protein
MIDGLLLICPCVPEHEKCNLLRHVTLVEDPTLLSSLESKEADDFKSIAVLQTPQTSKRFGDEIICGVKIADEAFLTKLQTERCAFSFNWTGF